MAKSLCILAAVTFLLCLNAALIEAENATTESFPLLNSTTLATFVTNGTEAVSVEPQDGHTQVNATTAVTKSPISTSTEKTKKEDVKKISKDSRETSKEEEDEDTKDKTTKLGR